MDRELPRAELQERAKEEAARRARPVEVRIEGLHKSFGENHVLRGVDLVVHRGDMVAIVGSSGCGKTVLLDHIIGTLAPDDGRVLVADHESPDGRLVDLAELDEDGMNRLRIHWAVLFQRNALFSGTVYENIALWLREVKRLSEKEIEPRVRRAVVAVGLDPDTVLEKDRDDLSGGMAKRVAVARAIAMEPLLVFYDEPTTGLDPKHARQIHELIDQTHHHADAGDGRARTTVIITHDKDLLRRLEPRIIMLHEGRVFFDGTYDEFEEAASPVIRPYFDDMPVLQRRVLAD